MSEETTLFGEEHVRRYRQTNGAEGHIWREGSTVLLLTTKGRKTGKRRTTPLIYARDGDAYVIVASNGGDPEHPGWYKNLRADPDIELQVLDDVFAARASTVDTGERARLWPLVNQVWRHYDSYRELTDREIPLVRLERIR